MALERSNNNASAVHGAIMKNTIYIAYLRQQTDFPVLYCVKKKRSRIIDRSTSSRERLGVHLLLSAHDITLLNISIPPNSKKYIQKILPHLVEPYLAKPIEAVKILLLKYSKNQISVAIINKKRWQSVIKHIEQSGWQLNKIWIDALCLPVSDDTSSLFMLSEQQVLWRSPDDYIFSGALTLLEKTHDYKTHPVNYLNTHSQEESDSIEQLLSWAQTTKHQLFTTIKENTIKPKSIIVLLIMFALTLWTLNIYVSNQNNRQLADNYYDGSVMLFHQVLPQYKKVPTRSYLSQQLSLVLEKQSNMEETHWYAWLHMFTDAVSAYDVEILNISYETQPEHMILILKTKDQVSIEALKNTLAERLNINSVIIEKQENSIVSKLEIVK